jgi:hypothetical protein
MAQGLKPFDSIDLMGVTKIMSAPGAPLNRCERIVLQFAAGCSIKLFKGATFSQRA